MKQITISELENPALYGNRDMVRQHAKRDNKEVYNIPLKKIKVVAEYNPRTVFDGIEELSIDIGINGQESPGTVIPLKDGSFALIKGERRYRALKMLEEKGIKRDFKAFLADKNFTLEDHYFSELSTQHTDHLKPNEVSELIQRLLNLGKTQKQIAERTGRSQSWVSNFIQFSREDSAVKAVVNEGKMSMSAVLKSKKQIGNKTERTEKIKHQASKSTGKIMESDVTGINKKLEKAKKITAALKQELESNPIPLNYDLVTEIIYQNL